jgi:hypothetical protein
MRELLMEDQGATPQAALAVFADQSANICVLVRIE